MQQSNAALFHIEDEVKSNEDFRQVISTGEHMQLVYMNIKPGDDIPYEMHENVDQFFRVEQGSMTVFYRTSVDIENSFIVKEADACIVYAKTWHRVLANKDSGVKLYTIYAPPNHPRNRRQSTRDEALEQEKKEEKIEENKSKNWKNQKAFYKLLLFTNGFLYF